MRSTEMSLLIAGLGYCGEAIARAAAARGIAVTATLRGPRPPIPPLALIPFAAAGPALAEATHLLVTAPPDGAGDPLIAVHAAALAAAPALRWIGYLSTTGVYGDRAGAWVDEETAPAPSPGRSAWRLAAENQWRAFAGRTAVDIFRLAGIYGPGRSAFDQIRAGTARRIDKPGHEFGRIHRDDITRAVLAALAQEPPPGVRVFNLADDLPSQAEAVIAAAARLLGREPPPLIPYAEAAATMSPMAQSFWAENRKVASAATKARLGIAWRYPDYRSGLAAILAEERREHPPEEREIGGP